MMIRSSFPDLFMASMLPALEEVTMMKFARHPPQYSRIFRVSSSGKSIEQYSEMTGLGLGVEIPEGGDMRYDQPLPGFRKTYIHAQFGLGYRASRIMADDDRFGVIKQMAGELGRSMRETVELHAAADLNNGFAGGAFAGPDGFPLFSATHPLVKAGGVWSNTGTAADLDVTSLELALTQFRNMIDPAGKKIRMVPDQLVLPTALEFAAAEMLKGLMRSDTANNTINAFKNRVGMASFSDIFIYEYLTDPDAWFVRATKEETSLRFWWRERPSLVHEIHFDSRSLKSAMWMRFSHGWDNAFGWYGNPGAA
jgi:phage major head subunit gpT-like protein